MSNLIKRICGCRSESRRRKNAADSDSQDTVQAAIVTASAANLPTRKGLEAYFPDNQTLGLRVLHDPQNARIDIVFIHGLMGNAYETWLHDKTGVYWPVELLAKEMPDARIISFGYDSEVLGLFSPLGQNNLRGHADSLLGQLGNLRADSDLASNRPIILVVHSLGGLVAKKALCVSAQSPYTHLRHLHQHIKAVLFLGTPHRGSDLAPNAKRLADFLKLVGGSAVNANILEPLVRKSAILEEVENDFGNWLTNKRAANETFTLTCFYEELECPGLGFIVSKESATISGFPGPYSIHANHMQMAKFGDLGDVGFRSVHGELKRWARSVTQPSFELHSGPDVNAMLQSLAFYEMNTRREEVRIASAGTCAWAFESPSFTTFRENGGFLWVKGKPGSGKSTLMKEIIQVFTDTDDVVASFFFHGRGSSMQQSLLGLFRSILHQLSTDIPELASKMTTIFLDRTSRMGPASLKWDWTLPELKNIFASHLRKSPLRKRTWIFLDALDEAGEAAALELVHLLQDLLPTEAHSNKTIYNLGICFSCRHYPIVCENLELEMCLEHENHKDIAAFSRQVLMPRMKPAEAQELCDFIENRADGVFLWARLVLDQIIDLRRSHTFKQIRQRIEKIPAQLEDLYQEKLGQMNEQENSQGLRILQWVSFGARPMRLAELRIALLLDDKRPETALSECLNADDYIEEDELLMKVIIDRTRGLTQLVKRPLDESRFQRTRISDSETWQVELIHQSVKDYLQRVADEMNLGSAPSNLEIFRCCMRLILSPEYKVIVKGWFDDEIEGSKHLKFEQLLPFTVYATQYWYLHAKAAESHPELQNHLIQLLYAFSGNDIIDHWWKLYLFTTTHSYRHDPSEGQYRELDALLDLAFVIKKSQPPQDSPTLFHIFAVCEFFSALEQCTYLAGISDRFRDELGGTLLHWTVCSGQESAVRWLLSKMNCNPNQGDSEGRSPLHWLMSVDSVNKYAPRYENRLVVLEMILQDSRIDVNLRDDNGNTPLHEGVGHSRPGQLRSWIGRRNITTRIRRKEDQSRLEPLEMLLDQSNININPHNLCGWTPWDNALRRNRPETLYVLTSANLSRLKAGSGASSVSLNYKEHSFRQYIAVSNSDQHLWDSSERGSITLLHYAAQKGNEDLCQFLLASGFDPNVKDLWGREPIHRAAAFGHASVVSLLVDAGSNLSTRDAFGHQPVHKAVIGGHLEVAQQCARAPGFSGGPLLAAVLEARSEVAYNICLSETDFNAAPKGHSLAIVAAMDDDVAMMQVLLNRFGTSPITRALEEVMERGYFDIAILLLNKETNMAAKYNQEKILLLEAADKGNFQSVLFLINYGIGIKPKSPYLFMLLRGAAEQGQFRVVKELVKVAEKLKAKAWDTNRVPVLAGAPKSQAWLDEWHRRWSRRNTTCT